MATYYLDSSSLIKRYVVKIGSAWVKDLSDLSQNVLLTFAANGCRNSKCPRPSPP